MHTKRSDLERIEVKNASQGASKMAEMENLQADLNNALDANDLDGADALRQSILTEYPEHEAAAKAGHRLGLSMMMRHKKLDEAIELFRNAANHPSGCESSLAARVSLALCYWGQQKDQLAIFELRKLLPKNATPNVHTVTALEYLTFFMKENKAQASTVQALETTRREHLSQLVEQSEDDTEKAHYRLRLAMAYAESEDPASQQQAKDLCKKLQNNLQALDPEFHDQILELERALNRA